MEAAILPNLTLEDEVLTSGSLVASMLDTARAILSASFPEITTVLLVVDTDDGANSDVATYLSTTPRLKFIGALDELSNDPRTHVMPFSVADIKAFSRNPVHLDWRVAA